MESKRLVGETAPRLRVCASLVAVEIGERGKMNSARYTPPLHQARFLPSNWLHSFSDIFIYLLRILTAFWPIAAIIHPPSGDKLSADGIDQSRSSLSVTAN